MRKTHEVTYPDYLGEPAQLPRRQESARPSRIREWPHAEWLAVMAVGLGAVTSSLDNGVVTVSYPKFVEALHRPLSQVALLVLVSQLTVVSTLVLFGKRAGSLGRKRVYVDGFVLFLVGAVACSLAPNFALLLVARCVEALGIAMIQANSVALVASSVREQNRATALGMQASAQAIGLAIGPFVGGLLVGILPWRFIFLVSTPLVVLAFFASILFLPRSRSVVPREKLNIAGAVVLAAVCVGVFGGVTEVTKKGWTALTIIFFVLGALALIALFPVERRAPSPLFEPRLISQGVVRRSLLSIIVTWTTFFGLLTVIPFYVEQDLHHVTSVGGATTVAIPVGLILMAPMVGRIRRHIDDHVILRCATLLVLIGVAGSVLSSNLVELVSALVSVGFGVGASNTINSTCVMDKTDVVDRGVASGLINLARAGGSAVGVAAASTVIDVWGHSTVRVALVVLLVSSCAGAVIAWWPRASTPPPELSHREH